MILLTNDDGYKSIGLISLFEELSKYFSVTSIAPFEAKSWVGKSITTGKELILRKVRIKNSEVYCLSGTPADCIQIGLYDILDKRPILVVSGINIGGNIGHGRILSSGTIGATMEASIDGAKSIASSLYIPENIKKKTDFFNIRNIKMFENAAKITLKLIRILIKKEFNENIDLVSINIPFDADLNSNFEITRPFREPYGKLFHKKGKKFQHIHPVLKFKNLKKGTDLKALSEGKISITPISLKLFHQNSLNKFKMVIEKEWR